MSTTPICPCDGFEHPATISNQPGVDAVKYRAGDFLTFRRALLQSLPGEAELTAWRPMPEGDLALQMLEWWAYIADVLTFYNERSLNGNLLATATLPADIRGLIRILGYRPRPGIGGTANVAALLSGTRTVSLPAGFRLQSKPAPGQQPQTFETTTTFSLGLPDAVPAAPPGALAGPAGQLYLEGTVKSIHPGDLLMFAGQGTFIGAALVSVLSVNNLKDAAGNPYTEIVPASPLALPVADAASFRLLRSGHSFGLWPYASRFDGELFTSPMDTEGLDRSVRAGQVIVATVPGVSPAILTVAGTAEQIWYTNGNADTPPPAGTPPAAAPHLRITWNDPVDDRPFNDNAAAVQILVDWQPVGTLRNAPVAVYDGTTMTLLAASGRVFQVAAQETVLIEDADGNGVLATASVDAATPGVMSIASFAVTPPPALKMPLRVLHNVLTVSRGKTVDSELLGTGDATVPNQEFVLKKSPLTYLAAGDSYKSTLTVYVNGIQWTEAASFFEQPPNAQIFVTYEDDQQKTHLKFGDGVNGELLPSGAPVLAQYRIESGLEAPAPGALTTITKPFPGLRAVRYPVAGGGGADPDPLSQIRKYAPRSVLTFGRAISSDDYEAIAAGAPSVQRVRAYYAWNPEEQRATVTLYVGDTSAAVTSAQNALSTAADPNRPVSVIAATPVYAALFIAIRIQPGRIPPDVVAAVRDALADPTSGLFGSSRTGIGESFYFSQLSDACQSVAGVDAVSGAIFLLSRPDPQTGIYWGIPPRINAGIGEYFAIPPQLVFIFPEVLTSV